MEKGKIMAKTHSYLSEIKRRKEKERQIDQLVDLWRKYHKSYTKLYDEYSLLISQKPRHFKKLSKLDYSPDWSTFLRLEDEEEVKSFLAAKRCSVLSTIVYECHEFSIEAIIRLLSGELRRWHYWLGAGSKGGSKLGALPGSCSGNGRHFGGDSTAGEYS